MASLKVDGSVEGGAVAWKAFGLELFVLDRVSMGWLFMVDDVGLLILVKSTTRDKLGDDWIGIEWRVGLEFGGFEVVVSETISGVILGVDGSAGVIGWGIEGWISVVVLDGNWDVEIGIWEGTNIVAGGDAMDDGPGGTILEDAGCKDISRKG